MEKVQIDVNGEMNVPNIKKSFDFNDPTEIFHLVKNSMRPWTEFINTSNFKTVPALSRLNVRFFRNIKYFQSNYVFIFIILMIYCLITSPLILIVLVGVTFLSHKIRNNGEAVTICNQQMTRYQQIAAINITAIPILYLLGTGAALFWTMGASGFMIALHATLYNIDAIVTEESEGFLSEIV